VPLPKGGYAAVYGPCDCALRLRGGSGKGAHSTPTDDYYVVTSKLEIFR
jgi:hypothetical protein